MTTTTTDAPTKLAIDPEDLTLDELEEFEQMLGGSFDDAFGKGRPQAPALKAVALLILRRDNPDVTLEDVGKLKLSQIDVDGSEGSQGE